MKKIKKERVYVIIAVVAAIITIGIIVYFVFFHHKNVSNDKEYPVYEEYSFLVEETTNELENTDIYSLQQQVFLYYKDVFNSDTYDLENPLIIQDPFQYSPQTALIMFNTSKKLSVTVTIKGKHDDDFVIKFDAQKEHILPIYGLYGNYNNEVIIETSDGATSTQHIKVDKYITLDGVSVLQNNVKNSNGTFYFMTSSLGTSNLAIDNYGEVRWYISEGYTKGMTFLQNGHLLISNSKPGPDSTSTSGVVEIDMLGYVYAEYILEGGYHHDAYELPSGNLLILTSDTSSYSMADYIVEIDRKTGEVVKDWKLEDIVTKIDENVTNSYPTWGWVNGITYDEKTNSLILSVRNMNSVVSLGYDTKEINWILGEEKYWGSKFEPYLIKGVGDNFIYPHGEHSVSITDEGYLSIFNNGYDAYNEQDQACSSFKENASYAMYYKINTTNRTASVVWKFGGHEYFSYALSSFTKSTDNHRLFASGWHFADDEIYTYDLEDCNQFSVSNYDTYLIDFDENMNTTVKIKFNQGTFEAVRANIYNLEAVSVNPKEVTVHTNYSVTQTIKGNTSTPEYVELTKEEIEEYSNNTKFDISFTAQNNIITINAVADTDEKAYLTLITGEGKAYKYDVTSGDVNLKTVDMSNLPAGKYYIYMDIYGYKFNTLQYIIKED